jgi:hypothetical protein
MFCGKMLDPHGEEPPKAGVSNHEVERSHLRLRFNFRKRWGRQTRQNTGGPVPLLQILAGKCGFAGQLERRNDGSGTRGNGNAISVLT